MIRWTATQVSAAASRPVPARRTTCRTRNAVPSRGREMRKLIPGADAMDVRLRTRPGWRIASTWPIMPPSEKPNTWALSQPIASSTATVSPAMSASEYGSFGWVDRPESRLSRIARRKPAEPAASRNARGQCTR